MLYLYTLYGHKLIKLQKTKKTFCVTVKYEYISVIRDTKYKRSWQTAPASQGSSSHAQTHTHTRSELGLLFGKSCYEIPPQPANTSFVRSDKTRGISYFSVSCRVLCQVEAHRSLNPERVFPSDTPPPHTHTNPLSHTHTPYNLPPAPHTNPFPWLTHTSSSVSWKETWHGR